MILSNAISGVYSLSKEFIERLLKDGYEVSISTPSGVESVYFIGRGCRFIETPFSQRDKNGITDLRYMKRYWNMMKAEKPGLVLTYTLKSNIYGGIIAKLQNIPYMSNINGFGSAEENGGFHQNIALPLYRKALSRATCVFFQNQGTLKLFQNKGLLNSDYQLVPRSGVNLETFKLLEYPEGEAYQFLFIGRLIPKNGIEEYFNAAEYIHAKYPDTMFHVLGPPDHKYGDRMSELKRQGAVRYHGYTQDMNMFYRIAHCIIQPTFYPDDRSNALLESMASGRPVITTNHSGCKEIVETGVNGFLMKKGDTSDLIAKIESFIAIPYEQKKAMGLAGRAMVEQRFDRRVVVSTYMEEVRKIVRELQQE